MIGHARRIAIINNSHLTGIEYCVPGTPSNDELLEIMKSRGIEITNNSGAEPKVSSEIKQNEVIADNNQPIILNVLKKFVGLSNDQGHTSATIRKALNIKISDAHTALEQLREAGFIKKDFVTSSKEQVYAFTAQGNDYLIKNGYLD